MKTINLNDTIYVKLTKFGVAAFREFHYKLYEPIGMSFSRIMKLTSDLLAIYVDKEFNIDGLYKFQMHEFMMVFGGSVFTNFGQPLIEKNTIYLKEDILREADLP